MIKAAVIKVDCRQPDESTIQKAVTVLQKGGLVVAPTETRYGLLVRADWKKSLKKLYKIKKRPVTSPTALFVKALEQIAEYGMMTPTARALAEAAPQNRPLLRVDGLLTRDSRVKERKKYGRKKARKRFQFSKR